MSSSQKRALFVLALMALLLVCLLVWGGMRPECKDCTEDYKPGPAMKALGAVFRDAKPGMKLDREQYELKHGEVLAAPLRASTDAADDLRMLKLQQLQGTIAMHVVVRPGPRDPDLRKQASPPTTLPRDHEDAEHRSRLTFVVTKGGGQLVMRCTLGPCVIRVR
jgi:hypothetical protein